MVTFVGQWWTETRKPPVEEVASHLAALAWMGLRHLPKRPKLDGHSCGVNGGASLGEKKKSPRSVHELRSPEDDGKQAPLSCATSGTGEG